METFSSFSDNICTAWWIAPYYIPFLVFSGGGILSYVLLVLLFVFIPYFVNASLYGLAEFLSISSLANNCDRNIQKYLEIKIF